MVEFRITWVLADFTHDFGEVLEDDTVDGSHGLSSGDDDSHYA